MTARWTSAIAIVIATWVVSTAIASFVATLAGIWDSPAAGSVAAFLVVLTAYLAAPHHKLTFAIVFLASGAVAAWWFLEPAWFPESHPRAYQPTHIPVIVTYAGGALGLAAAALLEWRSRNRRDRTW